MLIGYFIINIYILSINYLFINLFCIFWKNKEGIYTGIKNISIINKYLANFFFIKKSKFQINALRLCCFDLRIIIKKN